MHSVFLNKLIGCTIDITIKTDTISNLYEEVIRVRNSISFIVISVQSVATVCDIMVVCCQMLFSEL